MEYWNIGRRGFGLRLRETAVIMGKGLKLRSIFKVEID